MIDDLPVLYAELPGHVYTDPERFERELDLVFGRRWLPAARIEEIPETGALARTLAGRQVLLTREADQVSCFYNVCAHRGSALVDDETSERFVKCGFHGWTYALDGRLVAVPGEKRFARVLRGECGLEGLATDEWGGWVWIRFDGDRSVGIGESLASWADEMGRYRPEHQQIWGRRLDEVPLNWKATVDAFNETYHVNFIHRASVGRLVDGAATTFRFDGPHSRMVLPVEQTLSQAIGRSGAPSATRTDKDLLPEQAHDHCNYTVFPDLILNCLPTWSIAIVFDPVAVDRTTLRTVMIADAPTNEKQRDAFDRQWEEFSKVLDEDLASIERIARGVHSRGFRGVRFGGEEARLIHFEQTVEDHLAADNIS